MNLEKLERQREALYSRKWLLVILLLVIWLPLAKFIEVQFNLSHGVIRYIGAPLMLLFYQNYMNAKRKYIDAISVEISNTVMNKLRPQWRHNPQIGLSTTEVFDTFLIKKRKWAKTSNLITGCMGAVNFQFCHVETTKLVLLNDLRPKIEFRGYFFIFDYPKFNTHPIHVHPLVNKDFGNYWKIPQRIKTDSTEFEEVYRTYAKDPVEARYVLNFALMARMIDLQSVLPGSVSYCFMNGKVYIALKINGTTIEPKINSPVDLEKIEAVYKKTFEMVEHFVEELRLQMDIWMEKEA